MRQSFYQIVCFLVLIGLQCAYGVSETAQPHDHWYATKTWVIPGADGWNAAVQRGLHQVLVKASGNPAVLEQPWVTEADTQAASWVQRYHYLNATERAGLPEREGRWLRIQFDPRPIRELLLKANIKPWQIDRPNTLVWFLLDHDGRQQILSHQDDSSVMQQFRLLLEQRGLPQIFPELDQQDQWLLSSKHLWTLHRGPIEQASERYHPDQVLVVKMVYQPYDQAWHADVQVLFPHAPVRQAVLNNTSLAGLMKEVADQALVFTYDFASLAEPLQQETTTVLQVMGIETMQAYQTLMALLKHQDLVKHAELSGLTPHGVFIRLKVVGSDSHFFRGLMALKQLTYESKQTNPAGRLWRFAWIEEPSEDGTLASNEVNTRDNNDNVGGQDDDAVDVGDGA